MARISLFLLLIPYFFPGFLPGIFGYPSNEVLSPYSGLPLKAEEEGRRPIVATVENSLPARPQAGLEHAEIVYEFLVEGGITRFLALYYREYPEKVGPIRSGRPYLLEAVREFQPIYLHIGGSADFYRLLQEESIQNLDEMGAGSIFYWRSTNRRPPFNLYTNLKKVFQFNLGDTPSLQRPYFLFQDRISFPLDQKSSIITIYYWGGYTVSYHYQEKTRDYLRFIHINPHLTEEGVHLQAQNLLILFTPTRVLDGEGRLSMDLEGGGPLLFFRDGFYFTGEWRRDQGRTFYNDEEGVELVFRKGSTWINVVPMSTRIDY